MKYIKGKNLFSVQFNLFQVCYRRRKVLKSIFPLRLDCTIRYAMVRYPFWWSLIRIYYILKNTADADVVNSHRCGSFNLRRLVCVCYKLHTGRIIIVNRPIRTKRSFQHPSRFRHGWYGLMDLLTCLYM